MTTKRILVIAVVLVLGLTLGATALLAQNTDYVNNQSLTKQVQVPIPSAEPGSNFVDADGDGICDLCGQTPTQGSGSNGMWNNGSGTMGRHGGSGNWGGVLGSDNTLLDIVAQTLNLTIDDVRNELATGISIADLAANHNVDVQLIINTFLAEHQAALDSAVAAGTLTQEQADLMQQRATNMITWRVTQPWGQSNTPLQGNGPCNGGQGGRQGGHGRGNGRS